MTVSLFLLALYRGWMGKSVTHNSLSRFSSSSLFDANVVRVIHSFARPLRLVKVRSTSPDIAYVDDQITICHSLDRLIVSHTISGQVIHQWQGTAKCHIQGALFHAAKQQVILTIWDLYLRTFALEFRSLEGQLLRRANINAHIYFSIAVDPVHHYIAVDEFNKLRVYDWDNLIEPKCVYEPDNVCIFRVNWDSFNHQLLVWIDVKSRMQNQIVYLAMTTLQIVDQHDTQGRVYFHPSRQCFSTQHSGKTTFWSKRDRLETVVWDTDDSTAIWKFCQGGQYGVVLQRDGQVIFRLE